MDTNETLLAQLHFEAEVARWERDLRAAALPHVFLKGIGFDRWLDRSAERVSRDIDLLCPRKALRSVTRLLKHAGYRCVVTEPNASTWLGPDNRIPIDLHDTLKGATVSPDAVWRIVERHVDAVIVAGMSMPVLGSPARELVAGLHLTLAGVHDARAKSDLEAAIKCSPPEMWKAADDLARQLGCRALFEAGFGATPELRQFATALGFSMTGADEILAPRAGREDAIGLLPALLSASPVEGLRLGSRFLRLHVARLELGGSRGATTERTRGMFQRLVMLPIVVWKLGERVFRALDGALRLRRVLRARNGA